jgi:quercetin dioxygenase-like cupin family protein
MDKINWNDLTEEQVNPQMKRKYIYGEKVMIAKMEFTDGFIVPWHSHDNEQITEVYEGTLRFWFDNDEQNHIDLLPGDSIIIPRNRPHKALIIGKVVETDTFSPPRQDWINSSDRYLRK